VYACIVPDLPVADQRMLLNLWHSFIKSLSGLCAKKLPGLFLCNLQQFDMLKKQHFEKFSRVGLCNPPSGSLCLTFHEMAESSHEQSARATILNSNRPKPLADSGLDHQKVTTRESTQRVSDGD
jgi:hypothetical protein